MNMKFPFTTSFGTQQRKELLLVEAVDEDGLCGWGESVAMLIPWYNEETVKTNWNMLEDYMIPKLIQDSIEHPDDVSAKLSFIRKNHMAKAAIEGAIWDLYAKKQQVPLARALGGSRDNIEVGVSIGIHKDVKALIQTIQDHLEQGYKRVKLKVMPGRDVEVIREVRRHFPDVPLMVDANSAYRLEDTDHLKQLDEFNLMMIEQPLASDDIIDHAKLQAQLQTPICLDESIHSVDDARKAIDLGSCGIINIKIGRVGGLTEAKKIHDLCAERQIPVWCGGMLEAGVGRAHNVAITTLSNFLLPGDTAASSRYWDEDIIEPEVTVSDGFIAVPDAPGIGYEVNREKVDRYTLSSKVYRRPADFS
ncbi:O-succinylbenzoate synthase [Alicyclobacillus ferrooxydans]|uniref:o-succinylbenzoate synthase n=2 Tax=Alicyclobacillus ferrooxydans TaxID=471514 RepID=A0A0P9ENW2_9BACL|nr:O-succinylbenzoate synthase [Alicyclobacillus ferrooxydans]